MILVFISTVVKNAAGMKIDESTKSTISSFSSVYIIGRVPFPHPVEYF
jgi:hypothetical protein